jgi:hypothetical protein
VGERFGELVGQKAVETALGSQVQTVVEWFIEEYV